jgi:NADH dehydrogenase
VVADLAATNAGGTHRLELAGPQRLTYDQIARLIARSAGRDRPLVHVPLGLVRWGLAGLRRAVGDAVFATWEEAELMEVPMVSERGTADAEALGVEPRPMGEVLGTSR